MAILANFRKNGNIVEMLAVKKKSLLCKIGKTHVIARSESDEAIRNH